MESESDSSIVCRRLGSRRRSVRRSTGKGMAVQSRATGRGQRIRRRQCEYQERQMPNRAESRLSEARMRAVEAWFGRVARAWVPAL